LFYATLLHLLAGAVTGSVFRIRTLLFLLGIVGVESTVLLLVQGTAATPWAIANLVAVQLGYLAGIYGRGVLEHSGSALSKFRSRRTP
jgi:hypothetical protein